MLWKAINFFLSRSDFSRLFHTERSWHTYRFTVFFISGRQDLPSDARVFTLTSFEALSFLLRPNKGFQFPPKCLLDLNNKAIFFSP